MIIYAIEEGRSNLNVLNRHPVYEGGYVFDEEKRELLRHGEGCEIERGVAVREGKWERGELKESTELFDGWYVKREGREVFDWGRTVEIHNWNEWENVHERVTDLVIPSNCCNEAEWSVFDVSGLKWLKSIVIGDDCFEYVDEVKLVGLSQLKRVLIGEKCFTTCKDDWPRSINPKGHFYLKDCEKLKELKMGHHSFSDYFVCEIDNLPSLEVIEMGELNEDSVNFYQASLELKSDSQRMS